MVNDKAMRKSMLYVKEDAGVILTKATSPSVIFTFRDPNMTAALWNYTQNLAAIDSTTKKKAGIKELEKLLNIL